MTPKALSRKDIGHGVERTQENWKKEFDKKLPLFTFVNNSEYGSELKIEEVKDFISTLLAEERNKVLEEVKTEMRKKLLKRAREVDYASPTEYDEATKIVSTVINKLKVK